MKSLNEIELERYDLQKSLDAGKSALERNIWGQFHTPWPLADALAKLAISYFGEKSRIQFLDPAFGTGTFYSALLSNSAPIDSAKAYELDKYYAEPTASFWKKFHISIENSDFLLAKPENIYNLIICNPPYIRHHHINKELKLKYKDIIDSNNGVKLSGLTGMYCHFMIQSSSWLADEGISIWLVPSEFLDVNYGAPVKEFLIKKVDLIRIHKFDPSDVQFSDALVSSSIVVFRKKGAKATTSTEFTFGNLESPKFSKTILTRELNPTAKWNSNFQITQKAASGTRFGDLFKIRRGIATGANDFFILPESVVLENSIPHKYLRPILPSPRYLKTQIIESDSNEYPILDQRNFLISTSESINSIRLDCPWLANYLENGSETIANGYLCKSRAPWYSQEARFPSMFLSSYMGRSNDEKVNPIRFIWNQSSAIATNSFLMIYPNPLLQSQIEKRKDLQRELFESLNNIPDSSIFEQTRSYGGGLFKLEPKELMNIRVDLNLAA